MITVSRRPSRASPICQMEFVASEKAAVPNAPTSSLDSPSSARPGRFARTMPATRRSRPVTRDATNPTSPSSASSSTNRRMGATSSTIRAACSSGIGRPDRSSAASRPSTSPATAVRPARSCPRPSAGSETTPTRRRAEQCATSGTRWACRGRSVRQTARSHPHPSRRRATSSSSASAPPSRRGATAPHPERTSQRTSRSTRAASSPGSSRVSRSATRAGWSGGVATRPTVTTPRSGPISGACPLLCAWSVIGNSRACFAVTAGRDTGGCQGLRTTFSQSSRLFLKISKPRSASSSGRVWVMIRVGSISPRSMRASSGFM